MASPDCFRSLTTVWLADIFGFPFGGQKGLNPSFQMLPLLYSGQNSAPWVPAAYPRLRSRIASSHYWELLLVNRLWLAFPTIRIVFPARHFHLTVPGR